MTTDVFGNVHLGYAVIETTKFDDWKRFGRDAIGMHLDEMMPDTIRFRLDANESRFLLRRGPAEDVVALGWHLDDHATFDEICRRVTDHGVPAGEGSDDDAKLRGVERFLRFPGPNGLAQEVYTTARTAPLALEIPGSGFVTGAGGFGHVAIATKNPHELRGYYNHVFDARLSDFIDETINGLKLKIRFLRVNERHHSVAIASVNRLPVNPIRTRVQHVNVQVGSLDDMVASYQRVKESGFDMALSVGQHTNDRELSYYALTPSGFEWEVGWNPIVVDESTWTPTTHQGISIWGHKPEGQSIVDKLQMFAVAARSVLHREDTVAPLSTPPIADD
ncbi:biphenyl-23-diol 12-dioxygenase [Mycobacterium bohemicum DSM 44277]|uniref:Extradiol ring-cleavage dioxygenase n=2 Tax=Mycobacterium bohemicum TaxID=56425 RepID=A0A1X1QY71_MYCBE|nr:VOC family protein [Mycobacterium bohemicum]MCV6968974.1 VOC family protein [Mycobacterium bohemicum]ORU96404.1 extradiol ring-cleavage dioxygenase [Mycobacterium bohemicum]CPR11268.1 biphenyl-23-diol 12-dioxygenase [Mycobacterium bohemicum DSM 44277]